MSEITEQKLVDQQEDLVNNQPLGSNNNAGQEDIDDEDEGKSSARERRKIEIRFIQDKSRRHITFSKRKAGIMKKAYELSVLTGTQVLLLVVSETGLVYTFTTPKLQPLVTKPEGKNLIQACLNAPEDAGEEEEASTPTSTQAGAPPTQAAQQSAQVGSTTPGQQGAPQGAPQGAYNSQQGIPNTGYLNPEQAAVYQTYFGGMNSQQNQF